MYYNINISLIIILTIGGINIDNIKEEIRVKSKIKYAVKEDLSKTRYKIRRELKSDIDNIKQDIEKDVRNLKKSNFRIKRDVEREIAENKDEINERIRNTKLSKNKKQSPLGIAEDKVQRLLNRDLNKEIKEAKRRIEIDIK